jgi:membrane-associated phospholipid phosphatase
VVTGIWMGRACLLVQRFLLILAGIIGIDALVIAVWLPSSEVTIDPSIPRDFATLELPVVALFAFSCLVVSRAKGDGSRLARALVSFFSAAKAVTLFVSALGPLMLLVGFVTPYLAASGNRPLIDKYLSDIDVALGFDWTGFIALVNRPYVADVLQFAYFSYTWQFILIMLLLCGRAEQLLELAAALGVAAGLTVIVFSIAPAMGPAAFYHATPDQFSAFAAAYPFNPIRHLQALRSGQPFVLTKGVGLVSFPSFHTAMALLLTYAVRSMRMVLIPAAVLNGLLVLGALCVGGHYLIDIVVGAVIALASVLLVNLPALSKKPGSQPAHRATCTASADVR